MIVENDYHPIVDCAKSAHIVSSESFGCLLLKVEREDIKEAINIFVQRGKNKALTLVFSSLQNV